MACRWSAVRRRPSHQADVRQAVGGLATQVDEAVQRPSVAEDHAAPVDRQDSEPHGLAVIGTGPGQAELDLQDGDGRFPVEG
ncbi:hypothetical protein AB0D13_12635 [Streptomyces sp. NPDC048430]|uniref:hypothetical protein n=1 Tax=Streptomyces sp. NPDC048430 TaxID=3155388 RepID=UPI00341718E1